MVLKESPRDMQFFVNSLVVSIGSLSFKNMEWNPTGFNFDFFPSPNKLKPIVFKILNLKKMKEYFNF
jgi:hypothetical protein